MNRTLIAGILAVAAWPAAAGCGPSAACADDAECPAGYACYYGSCVPPAGDGGESDGTAEADARPDVAPETDVADESSGEDVAPDVLPESEAAEDAPDESEEAEATPDAEVVEEADAEADAEAEAEASPPCAGAPVGGYCWYASAPDQSCDAACATHGGCDLAGTRDYAGSGGTDAQCVAVLAALGYGSYPHQNWSNNDLGCHFAWASWTYWSAALPTTCAAAAPGAAAAVRVCTCLE